MISQFLNWLGGMKSGGPLVEPPAWLGETGYGGMLRSARWDSVRNKFMAGKCCAACEATTLLECHHIIPFHVEPERELDESNLIPLCRQCHFFLGHLQDWAHWNPAIVADAATYLARYRQNQ